MKIVAIAASPASGVDLITGQGLAEALAGPQVVADVANSRSFEDLQPSGLQPNEAYSRLGRYVP